MIRCMFPLAAIDPGPVLMGLLGGLALFLFGLGLMTDAVKAVAGGSMRVLLARLTGNRFTAAFSGAFVTAAIHSSSVTPVLLVGFISRRTCGRVHPARLALLTVDLTRYRRRMSCVLW